MRTPAVALLCFLFCTVVGCDKGAKDGPPPPPKDEVRTQKRIEAILKAIRDDRPRAVAGMVAYRGSEPQRKWRDCCRYGLPEERAQVDRLLERLRPIADKPITWKSFRREKESEGTWLAWEVEVDGRAGTFACLDTPIGILLGDIDGFRRKLGGASKPRDDDAGEEDAAKEDVKKD